MQRRKEKLEPDTAALVLGNSSLNTASPLQTPGIPTNQSDASV